MEIITDRLLLRDFTDADFPAFAAYRCDPRYGRFYGESETSPDFSAQLIALFDTWRNASPRKNYQLAIIRHEDERLIGCAGIRTAAQVVGTGELGLELAPDTWGKGYASETARALLGFGFEGLGLQRIIGDTLARNDRVTRLVERLGFRPVREHSISGEEEDRFAGQTAAHRFAADEWDRREWELTFERWHERR